MGVKMADNMKLSNDNDDDDDDDCWGLKLMNGGSSGDTILSVPRSLVMSSQRTLEEMGGNDVFQPAFEILRTEEEGAMEEYRPQFLLMVKVLYELCAPFDDGESLWHPWLSSLPKDFTTGTYMNELERTFLSPISLALAEFEDRKLLAFRKAFQAIQNNIFEGWVLPSSQNDDDVLKWAFNVVFTRCWTYSDVEGLNADSNIVPLGDMFNHHEPADVIVEDDGSDSSDCIKFNLCQEVHDEEEGGKQLFLSYGLNSPHRFLIIFGFVDETMPEIFSQIVFTKPCPELLELGCDDRSKMVYRTQDGLISNAVWDSILYALLHSNPTEQTYLYNAHLKGDKASKAKIHAKYALEVLITIRNHVRDTLSHVEQKATTPTDDENKTESLFQENPRLKLILKQNKFMSNVYQKVSTRLDNMIDTEIANRRRQLMSKQ